MYQDIQKLKKKGLSKREVARCLQTVNAALRHWLNRRANGKIFRATREIPAILFEEEQKQLRSIPRCIFGGKYSGT